MSKEKFERTMASIFQVKKTEPAKKIKNKRKKGKG